MCAPSEHLQRVGQARAHRVPLDSTHPRLGPGLVPRAPQDAFPALLAPLHLQNAPHARLAPTADLARQHATHALQERTAPRRRPSARVAVPGATRRAPVKVAALRVQRVGTSAGVVPRVQLLAWPARLANTHPVRRPRAATAQQAATWEAQGLQAARLAQQVNSAQRPAPQRRQHAARARRTHSPMLDPRAVDLARQGGLPPQVRPPVSSPATPGSTS